MFLSSPLLLSPARPGRGFFYQLLVSDRMSEIDRPANVPKAAMELAPTEIRRPQLLRLSSDMLREMAERTERTKKLGGSAQRSPPVR